MEGEWLVLTNTTMLVCQVRQCKEEKIMFGGVCVHMFDTVACPSIGERLYVTEYGEGVCDCDDGWGRGEDGRCYQEFTQGFCQENSIIRIREEDNNCQARKKNGSYKPCVLPFMLNNEIYTGCAADQWPEILSEEVSGAPWCPTAVNDNLELEEDNWGLCSQECQVSGGQGQIVFKDSFDDMKRKMKRRHSVADSNTHLRCEDNPCGDPRMSLPHVLTWNVTNPVCHNLTSSSLVSPECEVSLAPDNTIRCCSHMDRIKCQQDGFLTTFSIVGSCLGKRCCRRRFVFSEYRQRCVRIFRSGKRRETTPTVPTTTKTATAITTETTMVTTTTSQTTISNAQILQTNTIVTTKQDTGDDEDITTISNN